MDLETELERQKDDVYIGRWRKYSTCRKYR